MILVPRDLELSRRRAPAREAALLYLSVVSEASIGEISEATGMRPSRIVAIFEGAPREYSRELSLVGQGAARVHGTRASRRYEITALGRAAALESATQLGLG